MGNFAGDELFAPEELIPWRAEWQDMPDYNMHDLEPQFQLLVSFACAADIEDFWKLIGQSVSKVIGKKMKSIWYPEQDIGHYANKRYIEEKQ